MTMYSKGNTRLSNSYPDLTVRRKTQDVETSKFSDIHTFSGNYIIKRDMILSKSCPDLKNLEKPVDQFSSCSERASLIAGDELALTDKTRDISYETDRNGQSSPGLIFENSLSISDNNSSSEFPSDDSPGSHEDFKTPGRDVPAKSPQYNLNRSSVYEKLGSSPDQSNLKYRPCYQLMPQFSFPQANMRWSFKKQSRVESKDPNIITLNEVDDNNDAAAPNIYAPAPPPPDVLDNQR